MSAIPPSRIRTEPSQRRRQGPRQTPASHTRPAGIEDAVRPLRISGSLALCAGIVILMGIITAEALFPGAYNTSQNQISDLGSTWNPGGIVREPSATIFNTTMLIAGLMIATSAGFLYRVSRRPAVSIAFGTLGLGVLLVGIFHGQMINGHFSSHGIHPIVAMVAFVAGPIAALLSSRLTHGPFRFVAAILGLIGLISLVLSGPLGDTRLGEGGIERWIAYPTILWLVAFGGYLLAAPPTDLWRPRRATTPIERDVRRVSGKVA